MENAGFLDNLAPVCKGRIFVFWVIGYEENYLYYVRVCVGGSNEYNPLLLRAKYDIRADVWIIRGC